MNDQCNTGGLVAAAIKESKSRGFRLRGYQKDDLARAALHDGAVFSWDPGLGKMLAGFIWPMLKDAKMTLIVAPEALHEQIMDEGKEKLGIVVRSLRSVAEFNADKTLREAAMQLGNGREITTTGWWITSYSALGFNGGDMWEPKEKDNGEVIINSVILGRRRAHPLYDEKHDCGIGKASEASGIRCIFQPNLALLVANLFDCVVCDEGVRLKSNESYTSLGVRELQPRFRLVLTATPIKNRLPDIFWLCQWASGGSAEPSARFPYPNTNEAKETFSDEHMLMEQNHTREAEHVAARGFYKRIVNRTPKICNIHRLWKLLGPIVLRRRKDDTGEDIVSKTIVPIRVKPGTAQQTVYKFHVDNKPKVAKNGKPMLPISQVVSQLQNLRQAALCPDTQNLRLSQLTLAEIKILIKTAAHNPNADEKLTRRAVLTARKGEATPFEGEKQVAVQILERMAESGKIDLSKVLEAAPTLQSTLEPFIVDADPQKHCRSWTDHNPKQAAILKLIEELISKGEQVAIMSPFQDFSQALYNRLVEAQVSACLLDGKKSPKKRGALAKQFKRQRFAVLIGGVQSMGEGHSFECCSHLILPSLEWAYDLNRQAIDRVHRLNSLKPVTIYTMVTTNTIDERLESVFRDKAESSMLALDGRLFSDPTDEINLGELLRDAIRNFDPAADTIDEKLIEEEWDASLRQKLTLAEERFREWHPPIVTDITGYRTTKREVREATTDAGLSTLNPLLSTIRNIPSATFAALLGTTNMAKVQRTRDAFETFCTAHGEHKDWRRAWQAFEKEPRAKVAKVATNVGGASAPRLTPPPATSRFRDAGEAADFIRGL